MNQKQATSETPIYVVILVRGSRIDFPVSVGRIPGQGTDEQFDRARKAALTAYPNAQILGAY